MTSQQKVLGVMQLDTQFPRIPGDIGNPESYDFPINVKVVPGASVERMVVEGDPALLDLFMETAKELEKEGVFAITTSCGFAALFQQEIAAAVNVPIFLSSLIQIPLVHMMIQSRIGIVTANGTSLSERHFRGANVPDNIPLAIKGLHDKPSFATTILDDTETIDPPQIEKEVVEAAQELIGIYPDIGAFVFECHNLAPYAPAVVKATGKPVFDIISFAHWIYGAISKREFI
ncbi:MAG: aspartate/glutamate racemase family protein [Chloroflexi bacterium]|nr:aspartate/glutamate racemase family protein [Chloroflexota bacterium]